MKKSLSCRDVGAGCDFSICAETEEEIFRQAAEHARKEHNRTEFSQELKDKARSAIREGC
jgi:predicted small metal-binding protein